MRYGVTMFVTDVSIGIVELARAVEERGLDSLWRPGHPPTPTSRATPPPAGGAEVAVTGSNPRSTKDDVAAAVAEAGLHVYALHGATPEEFQEQHVLALDIEPNIVIDDGGDLVPVRVAGVHLRAAARVQREDARAGVLAPTRDAHRVALLLALGGAFVAGRSTAPHAPARATARRRDVRIADRSCAGA